MNDRGAARERRAPRGALARGQPPGRDRAKAAKPASTASAAGTSTSAAHGSRAATAAANVRAARDPVRLDRRERDPARVVRRPSRPGRRAGERAGRARRAPTRCERARARARSSSTISPPSMFSCACRLTITSPASPPRSSSSFTARHRLDRAPGASRRRARRTPRARTGAAGCVAPRPSARATTSSEPERARTSRSPRP